jgi:PII-like signaling protein
MAEMVRIELIIEKMAMKRAGRLLQACGVTGYTVVPALAGFGRGTHWTRDTDISASQDMVVMISICPVERATEALDQLRDLLGSHIGVVSTSTVDVLRPERF